MIGSVFEERGVYQIKTRLLRAFDWSERDILTDRDVDRGPFSRDFDCYVYKSMISLFMPHVKSLKIGRHVFSAPVLQ